MHFAPRIFAAFVSFKVVERAGSRVFGGCADGDMIARDGDGGSKMIARCCIGCGEFFRLPPSLGPAFVALKNINRTCVGIYPLRSNGNKIVRDGNGYPKRMVGGGIRRGEFFELSPVVRTAFISLKEVGGTCAGTASIFVHRAHDG